MMLEVICYLKVNLISINLNHRCATFINVAYVDLIIFIEINNFDKKYCSFSKIFLLNNRNNINILSL